MDAVILPIEEVSGKLKLPSSKSYGQRVIAASLLIPSMDILNLGHSEDDLAALHIVQALGAKITYKNENEMHLDFSFSFKEEAFIYCNESGFSARLFAGLMLLNEEFTSIIGKGSLLSRPFDSIFSIYGQLGVQFQDNFGKLPLKIKGNRHARDLEIDGRISSQFISGVLYYLVGLRHSKPLMLRIRQITSRPYIDMTIDILSKLGAKIEWQDEGIRVYPSQLKSYASFVVESDWSSAAIWIIAASIGGKIRLGGLNPLSLQADRRILSVIQDIGSIFYWEDGDLIVEQRDHRPFAFNLKDAPDLAPILAVRAIFCEGESVLIGVHRLIHKESNRLDGIIKWLQMLNITYKLQDDVLSIFGKSKLIICAEQLESEVFITYNDHRMVMASSILALFLRGGTLKGIKAVKKSYPDFFQDLRNIGAKFYFSKN